MKRILAYLLALALVLHTGAFAAGAPPATPKMQFLSALGAPLVNGTVQVYLAGSTTPSPSWQDKGQTTLNTNPIVLDARGEALVWLNPALNYKFVLTSSAGAAQWTVDNIAGTFSAAEVTALIAAQSAALAASGGSALVGFIQSGAGATARTMQAKARERTTPEDFGAVGNGSTNDYTALANLSAAHNSLRIPGNSYSTGTATLTIGSQWVMGQKGATLKTGGLIVDTGADFYDWGIEKLILDGTGQTDKTGLTVDAGHRGVVTGLAITNYTGGTVSQAAVITDAFLNGFYGMRVQGNLFGILVEKNSNATSFYGSTFANNTNHGATVRGSYSVTFDASDFEYNYDGLVLGNLALTGAEPRGNRVLSSYFEGNTNNDVWIGDQASADRNRYAVAAFNYHQGGAGTVNGYTISYSDGARLLYNSFAVAPSNSKYFLRANSRNTTLIPFPRLDLVTTAEVSVEAGATVSDQTIQTGRGSMVLDGGGNGFADVVFTAPYEGGIPPIQVTFYSASPTDLTTAPTPFRVNIATAAGFRLRVIGGTAAATVTFLWRAGA